MIMGGIGDDTLRRVMMARSPSVKACYANALAANPALHGRVVLTIVISTTGYGQVALTTTASSGMEQVAECVKQQLATMHTSPTGATLRVPFVFTPG
jgi:hypothetical protein